MKSNTLTPTEVSPVPRLALRAPEAAEAIGVSERTLTTWTKEGRVPHLQLDDRGVILYPIDSLRRWLQNRTQHCSGQGEGHESHNSTKSE